MVSYLDIPYRVRPGLCPVNGIRDLLHWHSGMDWYNEFLWGLGQGAGFAYPRINAASPHRQIYFGNATPRQQAYLSGLLDAGLTVVENRFIQFSWKKARQVLEDGKPPILGPLDMFHLPFYPGIFHKRHIPIHFLLLVGYESQTAYFLDTGCPYVQPLALDTLQSAWDVGTPGVGKHHRLAIFDIPRSLQPVGGVVRRALHDQCRTMLHPPVSMQGILAMRKTAREITCWEREFGEEATSACLDQVRPFLNSPPDLQGNHLIAGCDIYSDILEEASRLAGLDFCEPIVSLQASIAIIPSLADAIRQHDLVDTASAFTRLPDIEERVFIALERIVME